MVSFFLLTLCLAPLLRPQVALGKLHREQTQKVKALQQKDLALCDLKIALHKGRFSWEDLLKMEHDKSDRSASLGRTGLLVFFDIEGEIHPIYVEKRECGR